MSNSYRNQIEVQINVNQRAGFYMHGPLVICISVSFIVPFFFDNRKTKDWSATQKNNKQIQKLHF